MELHIYDDATGERVLIPPEEYDTPRYYTMPGDVPSQIPAATPDMAQSQPQEDTNDMGASDGAGLGDYEADCGGDGYEDGENGSDDGFVENQEVWCTCQMIAANSTTSLHINWASIRGRSGMASRDSGCCDFLTETKSS